MEPHNHKWVPIPGLEHFPQRLCQCGAIKAAESMIGKNTITLSPGGSDVVRWSASQAPTAAGDIGMDVTTGRMRQFVGGAPQNVASVADIALQTAIFTTTITTGSFSTGALGFTPAFAIYTGFAIEDDESRTGVAVIRGTSTDARTAGAIVTGSVNPPGAYANGSACIQIFDGAATRSLDVTAFSSAGVTLAWDAGPGGTHTGQLLVIGTA